MRCALNTLRDGDTLLRFCYRRRARYYGAQDYATRPRVTLSALRYAALFIRKIYMRALILRALPDRCGVYARYQSALWRADDIRDTTRGEHCARGARRRTAVAFTLCRDERHAQFYTRYLI